MRIFVPRDLDGFFGLFVDNLVQLLLILGLCSGLCGMVGENSYLLHAHILPGAAVSILVGNIFYAWQAHRLAKAEGRNDVTALPYGINTPSLLVFIFFVMAPEYARTQDAVLAWKMGLVACLGSGIIELVGSLVGGWVRRHTPRAALLSTLAGIAIGFIAMTFALQIWARPVVAMLPLVVVLITYFSGVRFPLGLPGGFVAVAVGTLIAWLLPTSWTGIETLSLSAVSESWSERGWRPPIWAGGLLWDVLKDPQLWVKYLSVIVPMGLFNVIGSLQNVESAEAAGDRYPTAPSLAVNGLGTILAALFGSCFPTTIYIGHPGWKGLGARAGYSSLNGLVVTVLCLTGTVGFMSQLVPLDAGIAIVLWIGVIITAQAFQATPLPHAPAVAVGLFPALAAWGATVVMGAFLAAGGTDMQTMLQSNLRTELNGFLLHGLLLMERGYIFTCMITAALCACLIERQFAYAAIWAAVGVGATAIGMMHSYLLSGNIVDYYMIGAAVPDGSFAYPAWDICAGYAFIAAVCAAAAIYYHRQQAEELRGESI